jgi:hypothetical protein
MDLPWQTMLYTIAQYVLVILVEIMFNLIFNLKKRKRYGRKKKKVIWKVLYKTIARLPGLLLLRKMMLQGHT